MTPEAQKLRDQMERAKADYMVLKRQRQKYQQEADRLFDLQKAADEESAKRQDALDEYGLSPAIKKARKEALKRANAKFRAAYKEFSRAIHRRDKADEQMRWAADDLLEARMRLEDLGYKVNPMAAKKAKKKPSAKQLAARRKFAAAAKARAKAAKKTTRKSLTDKKRRQFIKDLKAGKYRKPAKKAAKKRNGTVIKAKRIEHLDVSKIHSLGAVPNPAKTARAKARKNPALEILREAKPAKRGNQQGWLLGKEFIARGKGTKKLPGGALFDTNAGFVYRRVENPKRKKNIAGFMQDGVFHPIRSGIEQRTTKSGTRRVKSKKAYKPSKVGEKFTYSPKKSAKRASQTKRMKAATAQRKATTTRLATRSLQRSYPLKGKRNPNDAAKAGYESFQGKASTKSTALNFPNGTPANVYKLGSLHSITLADGRTIKPSGKAVWLCADTKGKLHLGTTGERLTNAPKGSLGKVKEVEYITSKPHLGDSKPARYFHQLGEETGEKPTLYSDGNGGLVFKGGAYSITSRGIVN